MEAVIRTICRSAVLLALASCGARTDLDMLENPPKEVAAGDRFTCARRARGSVVCWGIGEHGQAGDGTTEDHLVPSAPVQHLNDAVQLASGNAHTCARRANGSIVCWGSNEFGQLGDGTNTDRASPVTVPDLVDAVEVAAGGETTCGSLQAALDPASSPAASSRASTLRT